ncbi:gp436 family protein [Thauera sp. 2A1]|uniref:gp436 family protein n=1 Tax=Thauera sp. 2A1 TaxID=2570191 RepID=UPI001D176DAA|nr:DUF1320 domain-containing protein [Thauera sp. 2A1]KAI5914621.1 DUF1320 domain-containing protein [Thauera sp. 2A1]
MAEILIPRRRFSQPQGRQKVAQDWRDRLLSLVHFSSSGVTDVADETAVWTPTGQYWLEPSTHGDGLRLDNSAVGKVQNSTLMASVLNEPVTVVLFLPVVGAPPGAGCVFFGSEPYSSYSQIDTSGIFYFFGTGRGSHTEINNGAFYNSENRTIAFRQDVTGNAAYGGNALFIGKKKFVADSTGKLFNGATTIQYGGWSAISWQYQGVIGSAAIIRGSATDEEIQAAVDNPWMFYEDDPVRIYSFAAGAATVDGQTLTVSSSLIPGAATGSAAGSAPGAVVSLASAIVSGAASGQASSAGALVTESAALLPGAGSGAAAAAGQSIALAASILAGAASGAATVAGASLALATTLIPGAATAGATGNAPGAVVTAGTSLVPGAAVGAAAAAGASVSVAATLIPGAVTAGGTANAPGATIVTTASLAPGAATGGAVAGGVVLAAASSLIPGAASAGAVGNASGATVSASLSLLPGAATGAAAASGQALSLSASLLPGAATAGGAGVAPGDTLTTSASLSAGTASGAASVPAHTWQAFLSLITGAAVGESAGSEPAAAPGAEFVAFLALIVGEASGVVVDDYPMKYATLADMVTRFGQAELIQLTDTANVPPAYIDTTRVQIAINDAQMEIDSAVGRIYRLPLAGCIRPPVPPGTEPTAVAPPQLTRLACDIARFFLYDDLAPENEVVRRYKQAKATLDDIASGALQLTCPWGGSPGELIGTDVQSGAAEVYDCFSPRQITDDTLRGF